MNLSDVNITSSRLTLTSFIADDAPSIFAAVTPSLTRYMAFEPSPTAEAFAEVWRAWAPKMAAGTDIFLVIRQRDTDAFTGVAGQPADADLPPARAWLRSGRQMRRPIAVFRRRGRR